MTKVLLLVSTLLLTTVGCKKSKFALDSFLKKKSGSSSVKMKSGSTLIKNAKVYTVNGKTYEKADILIKDGLIAKISEKSIATTEGVEVIDAAGMQITPGLIDVHSHMGVYPMPSLSAHGDGNEATKKATPQVNAKDSFWPQDPALWRALEGGVTTIQVLPGSANLVGGESFIAKLDPKTTATEMKFVGAPRGIKMACGENPKRVYGKKGGPSTRMGNAAAFRELFQKAKEHDTSSKDAKDKKKAPKKIDFANAALKRVIAGETMVNLHCYRADDIATMIEISKEYGFKIRTVHHGLEAYKLKDILAKEGIAVATWADWWGFKAEAFDGIPHNIALLQVAGAKPIVHSDSEIDIRFLNIEAAKAWRSGLELGLEITEEEALSWITKNPAWAIGVDKYVGTLEEGKHADLVIWDGHPLSNYSKSKYIFINGKMVLDREKNVRPKSDFEVGYRKEAFLDGRDFRKVRGPLKLAPAKFNKGWMIDSKKSKGSFAITNVRLELPSNKLFDLHIEKGIISKVSPSGEAASWGVERINGDGKLLTAGLIESVSSLGLFEISAEKSASDRYGSSEESQADLKAIDSLNLQSIRIPMTRKEGITTNFSYIQMGTDLSGQGVGFDLVNQTNQELFSKGLLLSPIGKSGWSDKYSSRAEKWKRLRKIAKEVSNYSSGKVSKYDKGLILKENDYKEVVKFFKGKRPWLFAVDKVQDIEALLRYVDFVKKEYGFAISPVLLGGAESWLVANKLKERGIAVVVKPSELVPANFNKLRAREDLAAYLVSKGVDLIISAGATNDFTVRRLRQEMGFALKYGLSWKEGLKAITETPAKVLGLSTRGRIAVGQKANLVLWTGDLVEPLHTAATVWIGGVKVSLSDRQRLLAEKYL